MRILDKKLLRNLASLRGPLIAIVLIIACGVASFVTLVSAYRGLDRSKEAYYRRYRMADVFAPVKRAPRATLDRLAQVPGLRRVEGRIVFEVTLDLATEIQPVSGRVISVPDRHRRMLNDLHLVRGRWFDGDGTREVIVSDRFAREHDLGIGDVLPVIMNNRKQPLRIVATAVSPEFVYLIRGAGEILPDPRHFCVLWLSESFAEAAFDYEDAMNDVVATLERGAQPDRVMEQVDAVLDRYGGFGAYPLEDQLSNRYLTSEIEGLEGTVTFIPTIFLAVAAFVLHVLMGRLVRTQRGQVSILRAFGYTTRELVRHYLGVAVAVGFVGGVLGAGLGLVFARYVLRTYQDFFELPVLHLGVDPVAVTGGALVSLVFAVLGALGALRAVARLDPAEGLRPAAPPTYGRTVWERLGALWRWLGFTWRMILRDVSRARARSAITATGVALAASILLLTFYAGDATEVLMDVQFRLVERHDAKVTFHEARGRRAIHEIRSLKGVRRGEAELIVPVRFVHGWRSRRTALTGLEDDQQLLGLLDRDRRAVPLPERGLLLSRKLADLLGVRVGETVRVEVLTGRKQVFDAPVENVIDEYFGVFAYARLEPLSRWIDEAGALTGARLTIDPLEAEALGRTLKDLPAVASVSFRQQTIDLFRRVLQESQDISLRVLILFASIIVLGVVYNAARVSLAERERELASLHVLGMTHGEIGGIVAGENLLLTALGLAPGIALGASFAWLLSHVYETDLYRFPFVLQPASVIKTTVAVLLAAVLANLAVLRRLRRIDAVEVLKSRE